MTDKIDLSGMEEFITLNPGSNVLDICRGMKCGKTRARTELKRLNYTSFLFTQTRGQIAHYYSSVYAEKHNIPEFVGCKPKPRKHYAPIPVCGVSVLDDMLKLNQLWPAVN